MSSSAETVIQLSNPAQTKSLRYTGALFFLLGLISLAVAAALLSQANLILHTLARVPRFNANPLSFDIVPDCIHQLIINEMR